MHFHDFFFFLENDCNLGGKSSNIEYKRQRERLREGTPVEITPYRGVRELWEMSFQQSIYKWKKRGWKTIFTKVTRQAIFIKMY